MLQRVLDQQRETGRRCGRAWRAGVADTSDDRLPEHFLAARCSTTSNSGVAYLQTVAEPRR